MSASDLLLAALLLSAPHGTQEVSPAPERWPAIRDALLQTAVDWEIIDRRETSFVLTRPEDFQADVDFLRKRREVLAEAPHVIDAELLPDRSTISDYIRFNRAFRKNMERRLAWETDRAGLISAVIDENERLYKIWDAVRDAKSDLHYIVTRRMALSKLRELVGAEAFSSGKLAPYVPDWRFARLP